MRLRHVGYVWQLIADLPCLQVQAQCRGLQHDVQAPRRAERRIIHYSSKAGTLGALASRGNVSLVLCALLSRHQCCAGTPAQGGLHNPPRGSFSASHKADSACAAKRPCVRDLFNYSHSEMEKENRLSPVP